MRYVQSKKNTTIIALLVLTLISPVQANSFIKKHKGGKPLNFQISSGLGYIDGDLGGGKTAAKNFYRDLNLESVRASGEIAMVLRAEKIMRLIPALGFCHLHSSDGYTADYDRKKRNFESNTVLFEPSFRVEQRLNRLNEPYNRTGVYFFASAGLAMPIYKARVQYADRVNGVKHQLPARRGTTATMAIPLGLSCRYYFEKNTSFGLEVMARKTFSDEIDGVRASYSNEPSIYTKTDGVYNRSLSASDKRKDHYLTVMLSMRFKIKT